MSAPTTPADLLDLKLMPAWVNEPAQSNDYSNYEGEEQAAPFERRGPRPPRARGAGPRGTKGREPRAGERERRGRGPGPGRGERGEREQRPRGDRPPREALPPLPEVEVRFIPHAPAFDSVIAQIKSGPITYSVFALARMFLDKPERYDVQLNARAESPLVQLGEGGPVAADRRILEGSAFASAKDEFYHTEVTQTEPIKGNFTNVARHRESGTLLGPTNHHAYQPQLRALYEQRYSRRMSFQDFQRGIEVVNDPAVVEQWKEQARSVTKYSTKTEPPETFNSLAEAERHFRQHHLPTLLREAQTLTIGGVLSRRLPDRALGRVIENAWAAEIRSPSKMMQELSAGLRAAGLNIFRHRRGMLFVSPVRIRAFTHEGTSVSPSINAIMSKLAGTTGVARKQLAEQLVEGLTDQAEIDRVKLSLASDLRWLVSEGYLIEFNDGTLELPRPKGAPQPKAEQPVAAAKEEAAPASKEEAGALEGKAEAAPESPAEEDAGGLTVEQTVETLPAADEIPPNESKDAPAGISTP